MEHWGFKMEKDEIPVGNAENLKGQKFGRLTVLYRTNPINNTSGVCWKCQCDCGNILTVRANSLKTGNTKSCGCYKKEKISQVHSKDLMGQKFGRLTVLERVGSNIHGKALWKCKCDCGNYITVVGSSLLQGLTKSCGCLQKEPTHKEVIIPGTRFGKLTVLQEDYHKDGRVYWKCKCDCGNEITVMGKSLRGGHTQSCGCLIKERVREAIFKDLTGQRFGKLVVLEEYGYNDHGQILWKCKCDCGNIHITTGNILSRGECKSCGCLKSRGELKIKQLLETYNLNFIQQYSNKQCRYKNPLKFDFFINNQYFIEYDGEQHFHAFKRFGGEEQLKLQQKRDTIKNEYCKTNNIPLIRIPYWHYNKITIDDLRPETSQFLI